VNDPAAPSLSVHARVPLKFVPVTRWQAQPGIRIINRKRAAALLAAAVLGAGFKEATGQRGCRQRAPRRHYWRPDWFAPSARLGPTSAMLNPCSRTWNIKVPAHRLITKLELVSEAADVRSAGKDVVAIGKDRDRSVGRGVANGLSLKNPPA